MWEAWEEIVIFLISYRRLLVTRTTGNTNPAGSHH